jgi:hypothetical protein
LPDYREHVLETIYAGASIDYAPVRRSWFVLLGTRDDTVFHERVSFACDGRRITSLAMLYPYASATTTIVSSKRSRERSPQPRG